MLREKVVEVPTNSRGAVSCQGAKLPKNGAVAQRGAVAKYGETAVRTFQSYDTLVRWCIGAAVQCFKDGAIEL